MSHEPYPRTDRTRAGSTPAEAPGGRTELERQRAESEGGLPGQPTRDPFDEDEEDDEDGEEGLDEGGAEADEVYEAVPPQDSVPDEVAEDAARSLDERTEPRDRDPTPGDEPTRRAPSTGDLAHPPSDNA